MAKHKIDEAPAVPAQASAPADPKPHVIAETAVYTGKPEAPAAKL